MLTATQPGAIDAAAAVQPVLGGNALKTTEEVALDTTLTVGEDDRRILVHPPPRRQRFDESIG